ncbi:MAG: tetraacyldisaccharide 4'-kinase [Desulfobulbus sp.]|nr:tetraacyldisaccharide 4'-kinase [Desulfobulbus sp.]
MKTSPLLFSLGRPFSPLYSLAMRLREAGYRRGFFRSYHFPVPVISIGNLTMGGTGKTPMVHYLARLLQQNNFTPAIISRGYGGTSQHPVNIVSDGRSLLLDARAAGDEPRLLAESLPGVPVLTGVVRRLPAQRAVDLGADVLLLDDGFQHLPIRRDINLVLFNADRLAGNSRVFPGGDLREPVAALHRATGFVLTGVHELNRDRAQRFRDLLKTKFPAIPTFLTGYAVDTLVRLLPAGETVPVDIEEVADRKGYGFCGIAHPESFQETVRQFGADLTGFSSFADHQRYSETLVERLFSTAERTGADFLLTTEKDLVKFAGHAHKLSAPLYGLRMQVLADEEFTEAVLRVLRSWRPFSRANGQACVA